MNEKWNYVFYLMWFSYLVVSAALMFGGGFLLSRKTLNDVTKCVPLDKFDCDGLENGTMSKKCMDQVKVGRILSNSQSNLVCPPEKNRVVFLLVDALRYDFAEYNSDVRSPLPYQNRLVVIKELLEKYPKCSRLYRFMADPPTTTFQRIKAFVTGSLPTFVDVSSNFAAMELLEDNFIDQLTRNNGKTVLLGDDTWSRLIPGRWLRSHAMYSFHTWDLDTVDREVDSKIYDELKKNDWDLLVAHYLGVDHAGHRYGPNHSEMTRKLDETNERLKKIIENLPVDVLLYVIGDHGMTETGDHGGESKAERTAALFAFRKAGLGGNSDSTTVGKELLQTDLAPTISTALGIPPPAPSLGFMWLPILPEMNVSEKMLHLTNNLKQIRQYLIRYGEESQQVAPERLAQLINASREQLDKAQYVKTEEQLTTFAADARALVHNIRSIFRDVWVEFDSLSMLRALLLLLLAIFFNWLIMEGIPSDRLPSIFASSFVSNGFSAMGVCVGLSYTAYFMDYIEDFEHATTLSIGLVSAAMTCTLVIMHWDGITQRWHEGRALIYERFARTVLIASAVVLVSNSYIIEEGAGLSYLFLSAVGVMAWYIGTIKAFALWGGCGVALVFTRSYRGCREEQGDCWTAGGGSPSGQTSRLALVLALGSVACVVSVARRHIGYYGYGVVVSGLFACAHWAVGWGSLGSPLRSKVLARGAWMILAIVFGLLWRKDAKGPLLPLLVCTLLVYLANSLVLGASYAPSAALALVTGLIVLNMVCLLKQQGNSKFSLSTRCNSGVVCIWALMASYFFYGTGHHSTLGHVRWAPAFHAGDPNYMPIGPPITAFLVTLELFGMSGMFGLSVPLLALWGPNGATNVGPKMQLAAVFSLCLKFLLCSAIRLFAAALSSTIHCRHLMIWGVFAPKLLFEFGNCFAAITGCMVGATLVTWHTTTNPRAS